MQEILDGVLHWNARHPDIGVDVSSYLVTHSGAAIDPLLPAGETPASLGHPVEHVVLTNCLHLRSARDFGLPIQAPRAGLHRWEGRDVDAVPYDDGDELAPGVRAIRLGKISPDDFVLHIDAGPGVLAFADGIIRYGAVGFVGDELIGDDADEVKRATVDALDGLLDLDFDALLFAHGQPLPSGGKAALREFVDAHR